MNNHKLQIYYGDNLPILRGMPGKIFDLIYIDPPFNTHKKQTRMTSDGLISYSDKFPEYSSFLGLRLVEACRVMKNNASLFLHLDYREVHYAKIMLDNIFGRESFINEIIWAYDFGGRSTKKWSAKHDTILWYAKDPKNYTFNFEEMERIPYMAPGLVDKEKAARGKTPTDCFSADTEILTKDGWILFQELTMEHEIATVSQENKLIYEYPIALQRKKVNGNMIHFEGRDQDILVTPTHQMYIKTEKRNKYKFCKANEVPHSFNVLNKVKWDHNEIPDKISLKEYAKTEGKNKHRNICKDFELDDWLKFFGYFVTEGSVGKNVVSIAKSYKKVEEWNKIGKLLRKMGFSFSYRKQSLQFVIYSGQLSNYLMKFGKHSEKYIPRSILSLPSKKLKILWDVLLSCDGSKNGNSESYLTTSRQLANDVQELLFKLGYKSNIYILNRKNKKQQYRVAKKKFAQSIIRKHQITKKCYNGYVYCCSLPTYHTVVVRRNGKLSICGQCWWHTIVPTNGREKTGYPTQKPLGILNRIVKIHSSPGDLLLDFFAGSGTLGESALRHSRGCVLIDNNVQAVKIMANRLAFANPVLNFIDRMGVCHVLEL